jgi:hypothetical protein
MTTAFDAKTALVGLLRAAPEFADLGDDGIWYGYLGGNAGQRPREVIWVGEITWDDANGDAVGFMRRNETYSILLTVESHMPGDDQETANNRVRDRVATLVEVLRDPRALGVPGITECGIIPQLLGEGADPGGRGAIYVVAVRIRARF